MIQPQIESQSQDPTKVMKTIRQAGYLETRVNTFSNTLQCIATTELKSLKDVELIIGSLKLI